MRASGYLAAGFALHALTGCARFLAQQSAKEAGANFAKCAADNARTRFFIGWRVANFQLVLPTS